MNISLYSIMRRLFPLFFVAFPLLFILANLVGIFHGTSIGLITVMTQLFFDSVTGAVTNQSSIVIVIWIGIVLGIVTIGSEVMNGLHNFMGKTFLNKMVGFLGKKINDKASRIDPITYEAPEFLNDINKANEGMMNSISLVFMAVTILTFYVPYILFMGVYLFMLKPVLAVSLVLIFIPVIITQFVRSIVFAKLEDQAAPLRREYEYYERCISGREYFKETRILGAFTFFRDLYQTSLKVFGQRVWNAELKTGLLELGMKMITLTGYFGVLYLLFNAMLSGDISIGAFAAVFASIGLMFGIMEEVVSRHIGGMTKNLGTVRNFIRFLDLPEREGKELIVDAGNGVEFNRVSFRYPGAENDALTGVSLVLKKGETMAIVGENGAGKTTLVKLMTGLYLPTEGSVRISGVDTRELSMSSIYKGISAVFQKYQRYQMTLDDNIQISDMQTDREKKDVRDQRLEIAAGKADLDVREKTFPQAFNTMLSREFDGVDLSGGQWQRVAIARGFYRTGGLIVLDEPTAAIDPIEETRVYRKFAEIAKDKTSIIVTHRLGSAKIADRIVVMDHGQICEIGTHDELIKAKGKYAEMFNAQAQWFVI